MRVVYDLNKLQQILNDLTVLTGISIAFLDKNYERICGSVRENDFCEKIGRIEHLKEKCIKSDRDILDICRERRSFECHSCHAGLYDAALPIVVHGNIAGFLIMGRVRSKNSPEKCIFSDNTELSKLYEELPLFSSTQLLSLRTLLPNILFSDAIKIEHDEITDRITEYIKNNLNTNLNVNMLCKKFFVSRNFLYKCFKTHYNTTVNEYITKERISKVKELLLSSKDPVWLLCEKVGIYNYTYFCKLFKKKENLTPTEYRRKG